MENQQKKCSLNTHGDINAIFYCHECKIYMCNKCENHHSQLFVKHQQYKLDKNINEIFTGFCNVENHLEKLKYYCKTHNELCCSSCITKLKGKGVGQHTDCELFFIEDIKDEKKNKLEENIKCLENLSKILEQSIEELKIIFEKMKKSKDELKENIQKIFTKIRNALNEREDTLLLDVNKQFENIYFKESVLKESDKLPNKIKLSLEKGKITLNSEWNDENKLNLLINYCINIENDIKNINLINENIKKYNNHDDNLTINFFTESGNNIDKFLERINTFGSIVNKIFKFKKPPTNLYKDYEIIGEYDNILTINGNSSDWKGTTFEYELEKSKVNKWKIKILKSLKKNIKIGVVNTDYKDNLSYDRKYGWFFECDNNCLYSGPPHDYNGKSANLKIPQKEIIVIMDMNKGTLKFIIDGEDKGVSYNNIPIDKPLFPVVFLLNNNDTIEIIPC